MNTALTTLDHALKLAETGFRVFPLLAGTKVPPKGFAWKDEATTDANRIREWWCADSNFNVGIATGNGTIVLDVDTKNGKPGKESLEALEVSYGLPTSYRVATPSGGVHIYLKVNEQHRNRVDSIPDFPGIDIRSDGGYVVGPGSSIEGKPYMSLGGAIDAAGAEIEGLLLKDAPTHSIANTKEPAVQLDLPEHIALATEYLKTRAPEAVEGAGGNETTYTVAARCREFGLSQETTVELMLDHWNEVKAFPAWLPADLTTVVANAYKYATGSWGGSTAAGEFEAVDIDVGDPPHRLSEFLADASAKASAAARGLPKGVLDYKSGQLLPDPEWLIEDLIPQRRSSLWFGQSNTFKSFLAIDAGLSISLGRPWHGKAVQQCNVLYVANEGAIGIVKQRMPGWYDYHQVPEKQRQGFYVDTNLPALDDVASTAELIERCRQLKAGLVVLDIFGGTMNGTEVEDTTARAWVKNVVRMMAGGATVLTVAHTGWADKTRARMHTHFWGSFDSRVRIEGNKDQLTSVATIERHKDADSRGKWGFNLTPSFGTLVPVLDANSAPSARPEIGKKAQIALAMLQKAISSEGVVPTWIGGPDCRVVPRKTWRLACGDHLSGSPNENAHRVAFDRAVKDLQDAARVEAYGEYVWLLDH